MTMTAGTRLGPYEIREPLGAGGMGEVYLAQDTRLGRKVAVKVLPESFATDASRLARFAQEARAAAALNHPHIAAVFDVGEERGTHYMVQELLEGKTLREVMGSPMAATRAIPLATEIAEALAAAHKVGIVHRDLKPDNIFVAADGHAKVLDFGLAKFIEPGGAPGTEASMSPTILGTEAGEVMGTAGYMAPEQAQGAEVDHRADLFALGCVLYEMITGQGPFAGKNVYDTLGKIVSDDPAPIDSHVPETPLELQRIVRKCLSKQPELRYQNAADAAVDLRLLLREIEAGTAASGQTLPPVSEAVSTGRLSPLLVAGLLTVAVVAAVFATDALQPEPAPAPLRTFDFAFPEEHPGILPCCSSNLVIARDASLLAFFAAGEGGFGDGFGLYVRPFNSLSARRIGDVTGYVPSLSPDGEWIAYLSLGDGRPTLMKIAMAGGAPFELASVGFAPMFWADDGYIYLGSQDEADMRRIPENGGDIEQLGVTGLPEDVTPFRVWVLARESVALLDLASTSGNAFDEAGIAVVDLDTMAATMLVQEGSDPRWTTSGHVLWTRAGVVYAAPFDAGSRQLTGKAVPVLQGVSVDLTGAAQMTVADDGTLAWVPGEAAGVFDAPARLEWLDAEGSATPVVESERNYWNARLSPDETRLAVQVRIEASHSDVWLLDIAQDALTRLTSEGGNSPLWSPDGAWVYFNIPVDGDGDIWRRRSDFSAPAEPVLQREGDQNLESIAPDGQSLVYRERVDAPEEQEDGGQQDDLWLLPLDGTDPRPLVESPSDEYGAEFSPDGRLLAYTSLESGTGQLYVRELDGQRRWTVSAGRGFRPRWSRDGRQLFYGSEGGALFVVDVQFDGDYRQSTPRELEVPENLSTPWDISADGRVLAIRRDDLFGDQSGERARVNVTLNWFQELERLAPRDQ